MTDFILLEQLYKMIKEIPKPALFHRKGTKASGYFRPYMDFSDYTKANIFSSNDIVTPVEIRFSSMLGDDGTADTFRNIKGMEVKFIDKNYRYDMFCRSLPVTLTNNRNKLIDIISCFSVKRPFDMINNKRIWDYVCENPEALNGIIRLYSYYGITDSFINIEWYSVNLFVWINAYDLKTLVRYRWVPLYENQEDNLNSKHLMRSKAEFIAGYEPNRAENELMRLIDNSKYPGFELQLQMIDMSKQYDIKYEDRTLIWNEDEIPYTPAGVLIINKYENCLYDGEKLVHSACNNIDGIKVLEDEVSHLNDYLNMVTTYERGLL